MPPAAGASPQAKAALAFFKAGRAGDEAGIKRCVVSSKADEFDGLKLEKGEWRVSP